MFQNGREQLLLKLQQLFKGKDDVITSGRLKVCLTAPVILFLNKCFNDSRQYSNSQKYIVEYLKKCIQTVHTLKIIPGPTFKFNCVIDVSHFQSVQVLEIKKLAIGYISGLQTLRRNIKILKANYCVNEINDILALCGFDQSTEFAWPRVEVVDFSFNTISHLDASLRLLTSLQSLNLSQNELSDEEQNWMYLPEVTCLNIGCNKITKIPSFPENCCSRITTLILKNNDLSSLEGIEALSNLETLDVSTNCIMHFHSLSHLAYLNRLVSFSCYDNPVSYHKDYRITIISCLSPSPRNVPIVFDGQQLSVQESNNVGQSLQVDLSNYIPSRPYGSPVHVAHTKQDLEILFQSSTERSTPHTPDEKRKGRKIVIRQPSIRNVGEEQSLETSNSNDNMLKISEELEKLEKFKKDAGEDYLVVRNQEQLKDVKEQAMAATPSDTFDSSHFFLQEENSEENLCLESPPPTKVEIQSIHEDEERLFLVSLKQAVMTEEGESNSENIFVTVKDNFILESEYNLKVICTLDLNSLIDVQTIISEKNVTVQLKFDYINKEKRFREYIMDDEKSCESFVALVKHFVKEPDKDRAIPKKIFKCLKCSAWYSVDEEITICSYCHSSMVLEVTQDAPETNASRQSKIDNSRPQTFSQSPDLIPKNVNNPGVPPDICINSSEKDKSDLSSEYGALVSSIKLKSKEVSYEDSFNEVDAQTIYPLILPSHGQRSSPSAATDISSDDSSSGVVKSLYHKFRQSSDNSSPQYSPASSLSESESRTSTPVGGKRSSAINFSMDSCTHCDHRLKLYFETKMFKGGDQEEFCCMIKCPLVSYGHTQGIPSLLVISNIAAYICKVTGFESSKPKEWLSVKVSYLLIDLRYLEYGLQSQSFKLEFAQPSGCHTYLVGDSRRCEDFLSNLRNVVKKACRKENKKHPTVSKANPQTFSNIRIQVFGVKDESLMFKGQRLYEQAVNFTEPPLVKDHKNWFRLLPQSMLGREFIDWLISHKEASNYREAVQVGQLLLDAGVIQCFNKDCGFLEKDQYYYFNLSEGTHKGNVDDLPQDNSVKSSEIDTTIKQYILAHWSPSSKKKDHESSIPISIIITSTHISLAEENHQWPLPRFHEPPVSLSGPQFVLFTKQKIINITDVKLFAESPRDIGIEFRDEDTPGNIGDARWLLVMETEHTLRTFLDAIKELWEEKFGVELPVNLIA